MSWLVESILDESAVMLMWGRPGEGKTWAAMEFCRALLTGEKAFGRYGVSECDQILYLNADQMNKDKLMRRFKTLNGGEIPEGANVINKQGLKLLKRERGEYVPANKGEGGFWHTFGSKKPKLVVIDSLTEVIDDANDNTEMVALVGSLREAAEALQSKTAFIIIHHSRKDGSEPLGASQLTAKIDDEFKVSKVQEGDMDLEIPHAYQVQRGKKYRYALTNGFEFSLPHDGTATFEKELSMSVDEDMKKHIVELLSFVDEYEPPEAWEHPPNVIPGADWVSCMGAERGPQQAREILDVSMDKGLIDRIGINVEKKSKKKGAEPRGYLYTMTNRGRHVLETMTTEAEVQAMEDLSDHFGDLSEEEGGSSNGDGSEAQKVARSKKKRVLPVSGSAVEEQLKRKKHKLSDEASGLECDLCGLPEVYCECQRMMANAPSLLDTFCEVCKRAPCECSDEVLQEIAIREKMGSERRW